MLNRLVALVLAAGIAAAPAAAVTYDAFASFDGTQGAGGFTYGSWNGSTFTPFTGDTGCSGKISGVVCLGDLPGAFKSTIGAHSSDSVLVPGNALILHPGPDAGQSAALFFTVPISGIYSFTVTGFVADTSPSGVILKGSVIGAPDAPLAFLGANNLAFNSTYFSFLPAGLQIGLSVDYEGVYYNDSTGINFVLESLAVPEPASWTLMIVGFGLAGVMLRRRSALLA